MPLQLNKEIPSATSHGSRDVEGSASSSRTESERSVEVIVSEIEETVEEEVQEETVVEEVHREIELLSDEEDRAVRRITAVPL